jgi:hypothetical protein
MATIPTTAYCGDSISFNATFAPGSSGKVVLRHTETGRVISITPTITGEKWLIDIAPIDTAEADAGEYIVRAVVEIGGARTTEPLGSIRLLAPVDRPARSTHIRKMISLLEGHLENRLDDSEGRGLESYTIGGVPITKIAIPEAVKLLDHYKRALQTEIEKERAEQGLTSNRIFNTTFR